MFPQLPILGLPTYGLLVAVGFVAALTLLGRTARAVRLPVRTVQDTAILAALCGLVGAKIALVAVHPELVWPRPWLLLTQGGVFYGGVLGAVACVLLRARHVGIDAHALGDACAPALALGHAFGRVGCFLAGCCWGETCDLPWAVAYRDPQSLVLRVKPWLAGHGLHPTQLYEAGGEMALFLVTLWLLRRRVFPGQVWWTYVASYAALRLGVEELRGDPRGSWAGGALSTSQVIAAAALVAGVALLAWCRRRARSAGRAPVPPDAP